MLSTRPCTCADPENSVGGGVLPWTFYLVIKVGPTDLPQGAIQLQLLLKGSRNQ